MIRKTFIAFLAIAFISCNTTDVDLATKSDFKNFSEDPYIIGVITSIYKSNSGEEPFLYVLVEEKPSKAGGNKIDFFVSDSTEILLQKKNGDIESFPKNKLKKYQIVGGWPTRYVLDTDPLQAVAKRIVVIK